MCIRDRYKGLRFSGWNISEKSGVISTNYEEVYLNAEYENYMVRYVLDDMTTRKNGKGHIAEFTSTDLKEWASAGTFMTMMWDRFYECPDVFKMGDWWYLVYSEHRGAAHRGAQGRPRRRDPAPGRACHEARRPVDPRASSRCMRGLHERKRPRSPA